MAADIRPARAGDVDALVAIENAAFSADRISRQSFRRLVASRSAMVLVAWGDAQIVGYCIVLFRAGSRTARLYSIAAAPNSGIGRQLLGAAESRLAERGSGVLRLEVRDDNHRAISLYERNGYRPIGRIAGYYADGMTARRYQKMLAPPPAAAGTPQP